MLAHLDAGRGTLISMVTAGDRRFRFGPARRLKASADFAAILAAPREQSLKASRPMLSLSATWTDVVAAASAAGSVRFGVTVGKRNARRSVDRALIRRIVREACRHQAGAFETRAARGAIRIDVVLRLKAPLTDSAGRALAMTQWRRQVRVEADALLETALVELALRVGRSELN